MISRTARTCSRHLRAGHRSYGSGIPEENWLDGETQHLTGPLPASCTKAAVIVVTTNAIAAENLTIERRLPYRTESRVTMRSDAKTSGLCMSHPPVWSSDRLRLGRPGWQSQLRLRDGA